jgi:hypothetical protein
LKNEILSFKIISTLIKGFYLPSSPGSAHSAAGPRSPLRPISPLIPFNPGLPSFPKAPLKDKKIHVLNSNLLYNPISHINPRFPFSPRWPGKPLEPFRPCKPGVPSNPVYPASPRSPLATQLENYFVHSLFKKIESRINLRWRHWTRRTRKTFIPLLSS